MAEIEELYKRLFEAPPTLVAILIIFAVIALMIPLVFFALKGMLSAFIFAVLTFAMQYLLFQTKAVKVPRKYWFVPIMLPIIAFVIGFYGERTGAFLITPLTEKPPPPPLITIQEYAKAYPETIIVLTLLAILTFICITWRRPT